MKHIFILSLIIFTLFYLASPADARGVYTCDKRIVDKFSKCAPYSCKLTNEKSGKTTTYKLSGVKWGSCYFKISVDRKAQVCLLPKEHTRKYANAISSVYGYEDTIYTTPPKQAKRTIKSLEDVYCVDEKNERYISPNSTEPDFYESGGRQYPRIRSSKVCVGKNYDVEHVKVTDGRRLYRLPVKHIKKLEDRLNRFGTTSESFYNISKKICADYRKDTLKFTDIELNRKYIPNLSRLSMLKTVSIKVATPETHQDTYVDISNDRSSFKPEQLQKIRAHLGQQSYKEAVKYQKIPAQGVYEKIPFILISGSNLQTPKGNPVVWDCEHVKDYALCETSWLWNDTFLVTAKVKEANLRRQQVASVFGINSYLASITPHD